MSLRVALTKVLILLACLAAAEAGRRALDGYRLSSLRLVRIPGSSDRAWSAPGDLFDDTLLKTIPADPETDRRWFHARPPRVEPPAPDWVERRRAIGDNEANYVWNAAALNEPTVLEYLRNNESKLGDVFTFRPPSGERYPRYRLYPDTQIGFGVTNRFGWRSAEISTTRPPGTIRIAALGDSTTNMYPGMLEHWLNLWAAQSRLDVRFEVINAGRPSASALDVAAIFDTELAPVDPDYVIVYGFGNAFSTADTLIPLPPRVVKSAPASAPQMTTGAADRLSKRISAVFDPLVPWSAAADFLRHRIAGERSDSLAPEPPKPATQIVFPPDIDENAPNPARIAARRGGRLMGLDLYLQALNRIDAAAKARHARVFVSTFRVLAFDGLLLPTGGADAVLYDALNTYWWPYTYKEIHRLTQFFNRTLHVWAEGSGNSVIPIDEQMPWQRQLYGDGLHERPVGEALHAWIVLQRLMPVIREDLRQHRLPRQQPVAAAQNADGYWKIERVKISDAIATAEAMNAAILPPPADEIPGAFVLSKTAAADPGAHVTPGAAPAITTATAPSGYAASVPIESSVRAKLNGRGWISVQLKVNEGRLSVGVLDRSAQKFLAASGADASPDLHTIQLDVDDLADVGSVMISNDRGQIPARSQGELHGVVVERLRDQGGR